MTNYILTQVHLIKQENFSYLGINKTTNHMYMFAPAVISEAHHLYFTSDEEIKEGDWYVFDHKDSGTKGIFKARTERSEYYHKIVATTNKELWYKESKYGIQAPLHIIASIPNNLIELYIKRYNEGNPIKKVWLEQEAIGKEGEDKWHFPLKLNLDSSIIWKLEEGRLYTREELRRESKRAWIAGRIEYNSGMQHYEWFDKNYPE